MLAPGLGAANHALWTAGLVCSRPSHSADRYSDYTLVSTEPGSVAAHHDARHQLSGKFTPPACPRSPDSGVFLASGLSFRGGAGWWAFDDQSSPQPPVESPSQPTTSNGQSRTHHSGSGRIQLPQRPCDGLHRLLGTALLLQRHPLRGKALVAYRSPDYLGCARGADRPLSDLPRRPLGQRCTRCLLNRRGIVRPCRGFLSSTERAWRAGDTRGTCPHEGKEGVAVISDKEVVLSSRNLQERLFLAKRNIAYAGAQGKGSTKHVSTYD